jgi:hypothetical protein
MSLILRKLAQEKLDAAGFPNIYADINNSLYMQLSTECGRPIAQINGVSFSRKAPTNAEIDYAVELLEAFLVKHKTTMDTAINLEHKYKDLENPPEIPGVEADQRYGKLRVKIYINEDTYVTINDSGIVYFDNQLTVDILNKIKITKTQIDNANKLFKWCEKLQEVSSLKSKAWSVLNQCDI